MATKQICMSFHGTKSLSMLRYAVDLAMDELHNQVATCPNVIEYAADIEAAETERAYFERLLARIDRRLGVAK